MKLKLKTLVDKYKSLSAPVKASIWFTACNIIQKGIALISTPIFTRIMTTQQYGVYTIYQSWYQVLTIFATLNLSAGIFNNGLTKYPEKKSEFVSSLQGLSTTVTFVLFLIYIAIPQFWNELLGLGTLFVVAMFVQLLFEPAYLFWSAEQRYQYNYKSLIFTTMIIAIGSPLIGIIAVISTSYKAEARVLSFVLVQVVLGLYFYIRAFAKGKCFFNSFFWKYALSFNIPLIPHYLSMTVLNQSDRIMIDKMVGTSEAAIYGIAYTLAMMMTIITGAINSSFIPYTYQNIKRKHYKEIGSNANFILLLVAMGCAMAMAFGPELIKLFATEEYYDAIWVMPSVAASVFFMFLYPLFANIEFYYEKTKFVMVASCSGALLNILLNYIFIGLYGYYAAGYTTLICYMVFSFAHYLAYKKIVDNNSELEEIYDTKFIIALSVFVLAMMGIMIVGYSYTWLRYTILLVMVIVLFKNKTEILNKLMKLRKKD